MTTRTLHTRDRDIVSRLTDWLVAALAVLVIGLIILAAAAFAGTSAYYELTRTKSGEMGDLVQRELPVGVPASSVIAWLDSRGIEHGAPAPAGADDLKVLEAGIPAGTTVIRATIQNGGYGLDLGKIEMSFLLDLADVEMRFILDEAGNVKQHMVYEVHHRPTLIDLNAGDPQS